MFEKLFKPLIDDIYKKGFQAGVNAANSLQRKEENDRAYDLLRRGIEIGRKEILEELGDESIEEITAQEFKEITGMAEEPFGFVGTIDDIGLVLDEAN